MAKQLEDVVDEIVVSDLVILGGGLAGCIAGIRAAEKNIGVVIVEKAAIRRSGEAGRGMDHYPSIAHPRINGISAEEYGQKRADDCEGLANSKQSILTVKGALKIIPVLESLGVKLREEDGTFKMIAGRFGGGLTRRKDEKKLGTAGDFILYRGADLKLRLSSEVRKRKIRVYERTMMTGLITENERVLGATAVNVRNGKFLLFVAKAFLLATGGAQSRMYDYPFGTFPNNLFTGYSNPPGVGTGHIAAYRAGARLTNLEFVSVAINSLGWSPSPQGAVFCGNMQNTRGEDLFQKYRQIRQKEKGGGFSPWVRYTFMPSMSEPEIERDVIRYYWDSVPEEAEWYGAYMAANETPYVLKMTLQRGGLRKTPYELYPWLRGIIRSFGGVMRDQNGESSLKGLFVAGDVEGGGVPYGSAGALYWGYRIADHLAESLSGVETPLLGNGQREQIELEKKRVYAPLTVEDGVNPLELEDLVRKIMSYHVGVKRVEPRLNRALELLGLIKEKYVPRISAKSHHELMRAIEVQDIVELCDLHVRTSLIRTETRIPPYHYRVDYPQQDDASWRKNIVVRNMSGKMSYTLTTIE
ncbi:MAG: FAD-binding protein [Deltaproteobacteria bacterium]|nr:FAD-binding protein [Deltaproteobacteria bacterium]